MHNHMNYLGVDYGEKRIGLALANGALRIALPLDILPNDAKNLALHKLLAIIYEKEITDVIVGFPLGLHGQHTPQTGKVEQFTLQLAEQLAKKNVRIAYENEVFSSSLSRRFVSGRVDSVAAAIILQSYLDGQKKRGTSA